jgi:hypothetical protein
MGERQEEGSMYEGELRFEFQIVVVVTCMGIVDSMPDCGEVET